MLQILSNLNLNFADDSSDDSSSETGDACETQLENELPVPRGFLKTHVQSIENDDHYRAKTRSSPKAEEKCDSGLGTSVGKSESTSASDKCKGMQSRETSVCVKPSLIEGSVEAGQLSVEGLQAKATNTHMSAITRSISSFDAGSTSPKHQMTEQSIEEINRIIIDPILKEERLKAFHPLATSITQQIVKKQIVCLRDLEKTLLWVAPVSEFFSPKKLLFFLALGVWLISYFFVFKRTIRMETVQCFTISRALLFGAFINRLTSSASKTSDCLLTSRTLTATSGTLSNRFASMQKALK